MDQKFPNEWMSLSEYAKGGYHPQKSKLVRLAWYFASAIVFESCWFPSYRLKRWLLRRFGASIGAKVVIKPRVRIKYPWYLQVGDYCWIGEDAWIDNLVPVRIGRDVCISQGVYVCTGSHDSTRPTFDLMVESIEIADQAWIAARATILQGVEVPEGTVVAAGSVVTKSASIPPGMVIAGIPARVIGPRITERLEASISVPRQLSAIPR